VADEANEPSGDRLDEYVVFIHAGVAVVGEYHCSGCGYGVTVRGTLPTCPMCAATTWEQVAWSPFTRTAQLRS
jgi:rubredoxin